MKQKIEAAIRETLVVENKQSIWRAVEKILLIVEQDQALRQANVSGSLPPIDVDSAGAIAVSICEKVQPELSAQQQAMFIAGFQECVKYLGGNDR